MAGDRSAQFVEVQREAVRARVQCHGYPGAAGEGDAGRVRVVVRLQDEHFVTGFNQGQEGGGEGFGRSGRDQYLRLRVVGQAVPVELVVGDRLA